MAKKTVALALLLAFILGLPACIFTAVRGGDRPPAVLYVPLDNRPVNYDYVAALARMAGAELLIPPPALLNGGERETDAAPLWDWVLANAPRADALVLSLDTLFYGGLVPSRTHRLTAEELTARFDDFEKLTDSGRRPVYAFGVVMRAAASSASAGQPEYFAAWGDHLQRLSHLHDRVDRGLAGPEERADLARLESEIPPAVLSDYLGRRAVNHEITAKVIGLAEKGNLHHLTLGRDDTAPFSHTRMELRRLAAPIARANAAARRVDTHPGADELGALLLARALNDLNGFTPRVHVVYGTPGGGEITPRYEDTPLGENVGAHLSSLGGVSAADPHRADLVLLVHTPDNRTAEAAEKPDRAPDAPPDSAGLAAALAATGTPLAVADIAYANGGDDLLLRHLAVQGLLPRLAAYAGWNTAGNSIGTALAQGALFSFYSRRADFNREAYLECLLTRLIEDWGYQARVRPEITARYDAVAHGGTPVPARLVPELSSSLEAELNTFTETWLAPSFPAYRLRVTGVELPWNRLFDIRFRLTLQENC